MPEDLKYVARPLTVLVHQAMDSESYTQPTGEALSAIPGDWVVYNPYTCMYQVLNSFAFHTLYQTLAEFAKAQPNANSVEKTSLNVPETSVE